MLVMIEVIAVGINSIEDENSRTREENDNVVWPVSSSP